MPSTCTEVEGSDCCCIAGLPKWERPPREGELMVGSCEAGRGDSRCERKPLWALRLPDMML